MYMYMHIGSLCIDFSVSQCSISMSRARYMLRYGEKTVPLFFFPLSQHIYMELEFYEDKRRICSCF